MVVYLAILMNRYSRRIVGWHLGENMTEALVIHTLQMAICERDIPDGIVHYSDRGGQFAGSVYRAMLRRAGMRQSMSRADNCYDKAFMESCLGTLKTRCERAEHEGMDAAVHSIREYVHYYNCDHKHSVIGYLTPDRFESFINTRK